MKIIIDNHVIDTDAIVRVHYTNNDCKFTIFLHGGGALQILRDSHFCMPRPEEMPKWPSTDDVNYNRLKEEYINHPVVKEFEVQRQLTYKNNIKEVEQLYNIFMSVWEPDLSRFIDINKMVKPVE